MSSEINAEWSYWYVVMTDIKSEDTLLKDTPWTSKKAIFFSNYFDRLNYDSDFLSSTLEILLKDTELIRSYSL